MSNIVELKNALLCSLSLYITVIISSQHYTYSIYNTDSLIHITSSTEHFTPCYKNTLFKY